MQCSSSVSPSSSGSIIQTLSRNFSTLSLSIGIWLEKTGNSTEESVQKSLRVIRLLQESQCHKRGSVSHILLVFHFFFRCSHTRFFSAVWTQFWFWGIGKPCRRKAVRSITKVKMYGWNFTFHNSKFYLSTSPPYLYRNDIRPLRAVK